MIRRSFLKSTLSLLGLSSLWVGCAAVEKRKEVRIPGKIGILTRTDSESLARDRRASIDCAHGLVGTKHWVEGKCYLVTRVEVVDVAVGPFDYGPFDPREPFPCVRVVAHAWGYELPDEPPPSIPMRPDYV